MDPSIIETIRKNKEYLEKRYRIKKIGVFGSYSRNDETPGSDIDILVEFEKTPDLFEFFSAEEYFEKILKKRIDLVRIQGIKEKIRDNILSEVIYI